MSIDRDHYEQIRSLQRTLCHPGRTELPVDDAVAKAVASSPRWHLSAGDTMRAQLNAVVKSSGWPTVLLAVDLRKTEILMMTGLLDEHVAPLRRHVEAALEAVGVPEPRLELAAMSDEGALLHKVTRTTLRLGGGDVRWAEAAVNAVIFGCTRVDNPLHRKLVRGETSTATIHAIDISVDGALTCKAMDCAYTATDVITTVSNYLSKVKHYAPPTYFT